MKTKFFVIFEYNPILKNYIDILTTDNYLLALNKYNFLDNKYKETQFILVEVKKC